MSKILGIDYGERKIGFALADLENRIAFPRETFRYEKKAELLLKIEKLVIDEDIKKIVIGLPLNLQGEETFQTRITRKFAKDLEAELDINVDLQDERLSSKEAAKKVQKKETKKEDALAAQLILQSYLDKK